jgi:peptidoglycan/xylan/chitin deacetylase (PgdA/CDA1 family)
MHPAYVTRVLSQISARVSHKEAKLCIINFHRVVDEKNQHYSDYPSQAEFEAQIAGISRVLPVIPLQSGLIQLKNGELKRSAAVITFDDGYLDNLELAAPVLQKYGCDATFFVCTSQLSSFGIGGERIRLALQSTKKLFLDLSSLGLPRFDLSSIQKIKQSSDVLRQLYKYLDEDKQKQILATTFDMLEVEPKVSMLRPDDVKKLRKLGFGIGSHSHSHTLASTWDLQKFTDDVRHSCEILRGITGEQPRLFAFPNGKSGTDFAQEHVRELFKLGFESLLSTDWGFCGIRDLSGVVPRISVPKRSSVNTSLFILREILRQKEEV